MQYDRSLVAHKLLRWDKFITDYHLPDWDSIPDFGLYMDQVIVLLEQYLSFIPTPAGAKEHIVTSATINNYVRLKIMPAPVKRKYYRGGHQLQTHVVIDGRGRDDALLFLIHRRDEAEISLQQKHHLVHVQAKIRDGLPLGQVIVGYVLIPPLQLVGNEGFIVGHNATSIKAQLL